MYWPPFLPVGKPGSSPGQAGNHKLGNPPGDAVRALEVLVLAGDPCPERLRGRPNGAHSHRGAR